MQSRMRKIKRNKERDRQITSVCWRSLSAAAAAAAAASSPHVALLANVISRNFWRLSFSMHALFHSFYLILAFYIAIELTQLK